MQTKKTLCIIDSDVCFSSLLISRLQKYLPDIVAFQISRNIFEERPSLLLDNHFVLYNQNEISEEQRERMHLARRGEEIIYRCEK